MKKKEVGFRLKKIRKVLRLKQKEFAAILNMSDTYLSDIENGKQKPGYEVPGILAKEFNINLNYIFFGEGEMFIDPILRISDRIDEFAVNREDVRKFIYSFERSPAFQYYMFNEFRLLLEKRKEVISRELEEYEKKVHHE